MCLNFTLLSFKNSNMSLEIEENNYSGKAHIDKLFHIDKGLKDKNALKADFIEP